ncbi:uncharacterized protein ISCGN_011512 [Ixodes scapularis]
MAARNLRFIFLQVVWFVAAFHDAAATTCFVSDDNAYQEQVCPAFVFWDEPSPLDMTALPALLDHHIDWQPWAFDHGRKLQKLLSHPVTSGSGADMAARNLRLIFLQVVWFVAAFHDAAATTCFVSDDNAYQEQVCPAFVFWDEPSPLDMTALPALLDHHIDWQPWAFDHGRKLQKLLSHPVTSGSGADMAARNLRLIFLQVCYSYLHINVCKTKPRRRPGPAAHRRPWPGAAVLLPGPAGVVPIPADAVCYLGIASALTRLQAQSDCFFGELLPTLFTVKTKLQEKAGMDFVYCRPLLDAVTSGFIRRFDELLRMKPSANEATVAAVLHPYFKLRWLSREPQDVREHGQQLTEKAVIDFVNATKGVRAINLCSL